MSTSSRPTRFVISHLRSRLTSDDERKRSRAGFDGAFAAHLERNVETMSDSADDEIGRRIIVLQANPEELLAKMRSMPAEACCERELPRVPARARPLAVQILAALASDDAPPPGAGAAVKFRLVSGGLLVQGAKVSLYLAPARPALPDQGTRTLHAFSDGTGGVSFEYDPAIWVACAAMIEPPDAWSTVVTMPGPEQEISLTPLPASGPLDWWHLLSGATSHSDTSGSGIRIGVIDTGVGPHPYLDHVQGVGSFLDGQFTAGLNAALDCEQHGTHVCGIIGARPAAGTRHHAGLAPGADLLMARVFSATGGSNQGDVALAIDWLATSPVDLINMSLGGEYSIIEQDAVNQAWSRGVLCMCAAGNQNGAAIMFPAALPEAVAVSALGLLGMAPPGSLAAMNLPAAVDRRTALGLYLANFSNVGAQMACTAAGNGVVSTWPVGNGATGTPYAEMSGTSMAAPLATAALAVLLSREPRYRELPRTFFRAAFARAALLQSAASIGLSATLQGAGIARMRWALPLASPEPGAAAAPPAAAAAPPAAEQPAAYAARAPVTQDQPVMQDQPVAQDNPARSRTRLIIARTAKSERTIGDESGARDELLGRISRHAGVSLIQASGHQAVVDADPEAIAKLKDDLGEGYHVEEEKRRTPETPS